MEFPAKIALLALSFVGLGSLAYLLFYQRDDDDEIIVHRARCTEILIKVPKDSVGALIGRQGANLKSIEEKYGVSLYFTDRENDEDVRICRVRGSAHAARAAEDYIHSIIASQVLIETQEISIPTNACGRVIGKNGDTIRRISSQSNAKITVHREETFDNQRLVTIKGTAEQIASAKILLKQKVEEEWEYRSRLEQSLGSRSPRHVPKYLLAGPVNSDKSTSPVHEQLIPTGSDGLIQVFASALESPDRLWVQICGPSTVELDRLNEKMLEYYSKPEYKVINALDNVRKGQLVAAPFKYDDRLYRAEVDEITPTDEGDELTLYYVDYGDSNVCLKDCAYDLRPEFLGLRYQAIECCLARVKPRGGEWTEPGIDLFEELIHVALWKQVTARVHSYIERPTRARREGSPVPCIEIYDTSGDKEIDVAKVLVDEGFAVWSSEGENGDCHSRQISRSSVSELDDSAVKE